MDIAPGDERDDVLDALGPRVLLLANPQDSLVGVLGAVIDPVTGSPIPTRRLVVPSATSSLDVVRYSGIRELSVSAGVATDLLGSSSELSTHVSYDVTVWQTHYLVGDQPYDADARCCDAAGRVEVECEAGYVVRAFVGSGTLRYLSSEASSRSFGIEEGPFETYGNTRYRVERERRFTSAVFAVEVAAPEAVCERAFCDLRETSGACARCRVLGMEAELSSMTAPAEGALGVVCDGMRAEAEATVTVRGDLSVEDCEFGAPSATLRLRTEGAVSESFELGSSVGASSPLTFVRESPRLLASSAGLLVADLDLTDCRCGDLPARCVIGRELELAVEVTPR